MTGATAMTPHSLTITSGGERYSCSFPSGGGTSWVNVRTDAAPTPTLCRQLNRQVIDEYAETELHTWGKHYLPEYVAWLRRLCVMDSDFERLGLQFLVQSDASKQERRQSPLHVLGYRVGRSGPSAEARQEILRKAVAESFPNVGTAEYMANWGLPNTPRRVMAITLHLVRHLERATELDAEYTQAIVDWESDIAWLKEEFIDVATPPNYTPTGWCADLVASELTQWFDPPKHAS